MTDRREAKILHLPRHNMSAERPRRHEAPEFATDDEILELYDAIQDLAVMAPAPAGNRLVVDVWEKPELLAEYASLEVSDFMTQDDSGDTRRFVERVATLGIERVGDTFATSFTVAYYPGEMRFTFIDNGIAREWKPFYDQLTYEVCSPPFTAKLARNYAQEIECEIDTRARLARRRFMLGGVATNADY